jgi:hypothetical protein
MRSSLSSGAWAPLQDPPWEVSWRSLLDSIRNYSRPTAYSVDTPTCCRTWSPSSSLSLPLSKASYFSKRPTRDHQSRVVRRAVQKAVNISNPMSWRTRTRQLLYFHHDGGEHQQSVPSLRHQVELVTSPNLCPCRLTRRLIFDEALWPR